MTAWTNLQQEWCENIDEKKVTGIMLWDLSAAFDMLDPVLLCQKLKLYGLCDMSIRWFESFLIGRTQKVRIASSFSTARSITSGVPQGGIISPVLYIIYVSDFENWLKHSSASTYADDSGTAVIGEKIEEIIPKMEEDSDNILSFMASNSLVANATKTTVIFLNVKQAIDIPVRVGKSIVKSEATATLLGMNMNNKLNWKNHTSKLISSLNKKLFLLKRLKRTVDEKSLIKIAHAIFNSKLRYGIQLIGRIRMNNEDTLNNELNDLQKTQNKMLRLITNTRLKDRKRTEELLEHCNMLSVNQAMFQVKMVETWKALNNRDGPVKIGIQICEQGQIETRLTTSGKLIENGISNLSQATCLNDAARVWNKLPNKVKESGSINVLKTRLKSVLKTIPI